MKIAALIQGKRLFLMIKYRICFYFKQILTVSFSGQLSKKLL